MTAKKDRLTRREQIAEEGLKLAANGISAITMESVAKACGVVTSALYRHYRNKGELLDGVRELMRSKLLVNASRAVEQGGTSIDMLRRLAASHASLLYKHPGIPRLLFSEAALDKNSFRRKALYSMMNEYRAAAAAIAQKGQEEGELRGDVSPEDIVFMLLGTVIPPSFIFHVSDGEFDPREQVRRNFVLFEDAVKARSEGS